MIEIVDTTVRDGNQSLWGATGLTAQHLLSIAPTMDRVGFHALEWARAHPGHRIGDDIGDRSYIKPIDWHESEATMPSVTSGSTETDESAAERLWVFGSQHLIPPGKKKARSRK